MLHFGDLNLSKGGPYPVEYALRLGAGFGSQISMTLLHWVSTKDKAHQPVSSLGYEYRISDPASWQQWLSGLNGPTNPGLEVVNRTLRVRDVALGTRPPEIATALKLAPLPKPQVSVPHAKTPAPTAQAPVAIPVEAGAPREERKVAAPVSAPVAAAAVTTAAPIPAQPVQKEHGVDAVRERILALAVEKTGYPKDMLDLDLDLEADLGVDTVKQAEMFAAIREIYDIPRDENRKLRD